MESVSATLIRKKKIVDWELNYGRVITVDFSNHPSSLHPRLLLRHRVAHLYFQRFSRNPVQMHRLERIILEPGPAGKDMPQRRLVPPTFPREKRQPSEVGRQQK